MQMHAVWHRAGQLIQELGTGRTGFAQVLHDLHALRQLLALLLQVIDGLDARVKDGNVLIQMVITRHLSVNRLVDHLIRQPDRCERHTGERQQQHQEKLAPPFCQGLTPR